MTWLKRCLELFLNYLFPFLFVFGMQIVPVLLATPSYHPLDLAATLAKELGLFFLLLLDFVAFGAFWRSCALPEVTDFNPKPGGPATRMVDYYPALQRRMDRHMRLTWWSWGANVLLRVAVCLAGWVACGGWLAMKADRIGMLGVPGLLAVLMAGWFCGLILAVVVPTILLAIGLKLWSSLEPPDRRALDPPADTPGAEVRSPLKPFGWRALLARCMRLGVPVLAAALLMAGPYSLGRDLAQAARYAFLGAAAAAIAIYPVRVWTSHLVASWTDAWLEIVPDAALLLWHRSLPLGVKTSVAGTLAEAEIEPDGALRVGLRRFVLREGAAAPFLGQLRRMRGPEKPPPAGPQDPAE